MNEILMNDPESRNPIFVENNSLTTDRNTNYVMDSIL